jgi:hypothetical protein
MNSKNKKNGIVESKKSQYSTKEFRALQLEWYAKLDSTGFNDIERVGRLRSKIYDEYNAILPNSDSLIRHKYNFSTFQYYQNLRNFSHATRIASILPASALPKPLFSLRLNKNYRLDQSKPAHFVLLSTDRIILRMTGNGATIETISKHLRSRCKPPKHNRGRAGKPYSTFYVYKRLQRLILLMNFCTYGAKHVE